MGGMRAWSGFVEDKIEQARRDGLFNEVQGRGKPMERDEAEANPFIARCVLFDREERRGLTSRAGTSS